jgi:AcrR family transcriptional regulator
MTLADIAAALGVSKSSVSLWVRDVEFVPSAWRYGAQRRPYAQQIAKLRQIEELDREGRDRIGTLDDESFLAAGVALYTGEGTKGDGRVCFANTDPTMVRFFCAWLRRFFEVDEKRVTARVYLHEGLDLAVAEAFWSEISGLALEQFRAPYRAVANPTIRRNKHVYGCFYVRYDCVQTHRRIMGLMRALLSSQAIPG